VSNDACGRSGWNIWKLWHRKVISVGSAVGHFGTLWQYRGKFLVEASKSSRTAMLGGGHLIIVAAISQWRRRLSVDILSTFCGVFMVRCVNLMLSKFLHL